METARVMIGVVSRPHLLTEILIAVEPLAPLQVGKYHFILLQFFSQEILCWLSSLSAFNKLNLLFRGFRKASFPFLIWFTDLSMLRTSNFFVLVVSLSTLYPSLGDFFLPTATASGCVDFIDFVFFLTTLNCFYFLCSGRGAILSHRPSSFLFIWLLISFQLSPRAFPSKLGSSSSNAKPSSIIFYIAHINSEWIKNHHLCADLSKRETHWATWLRYLLSRLLLN